jgi:hypothetical protein
MKRRKTPRKVKVRKIFSISFFLTMFLWTALGKAQVPLEGMVLEKFNRENYANEGDLFAQFWNEPSADDQIYSAKELEGRGNLALYRGFYEEGANLDNFCQIKQHLEYPTSWDTEQATRGMVATLQYLGLDVVTNALAAYANYFDFTSDEYSNLIDNLVTNSCSPNLTVVSLKTLRKSMMLKFGVEKKMSLPSVQENPFFPENFSTGVAEEQGRQREFLVTTKLFKAFCSWGLNIDDLRYMAPLTANPIIVANLIRHMTGQKIVWQSSDNSLRMKNDPSSIKVACQHLVCRRSDVMSFKKYFPRGIGSNSLEDDLKKIYCINLRHQKMPTTSVHPRIKEWIKEDGPNIGALMASQMISLLTGIPDFLVRATSSENLKNLALEGLNRSWKMWAQGQLGALEKKLYYEESLTIDKVDRKHYFHPKKPIFKVMMDVNLGEFDTAVQMRGKVSMKYNINLRVDFLEWLRREWRYLDPTLEKRREHLVSTTVRNLEEKTNSITQYLKVVPWNKDIVKMIAKELIEQLSLYEGEPLNKVWANKKYYPVQVQLNYAPFALRYIHQKFLLLPPSK